MRITPSRSCSVNVRVARPASSSNVRVVWKAGEARGGTAPAGWASAKSTKTTIEPTSMRKLRGPTQDIRASHLIESLRATC